MKIALLSLVLFLSFWQAPSLQQLRDVYPQLSNDASLTEKILESLDEVKPNDGAKLLGYKGAVQTVMAKHLRNKREKKEFFTQGVAQLEAAIAMAPNDIELRCLRLSVQENSPKFLGYHKAKAEDKAFLLAHFSETSSGSISAFVKQYVVQSDEFSEAEKSQFN